MKLLFLLSLLILTTYSSLTITSYFNYPNFFFNQSVRLYDITFNEDGTEVFLSIFDGIVSKIVRYKIAQQLNFYQIGQYKQSFSGNIFQAIHIHNDYLIASSNQTFSTKVFNLTTFEFIGSLISDGFIVSSKYIESQNIWVFGDSQGQLMYFQMQNFPFGTFTPIFSSGINQCSTFIQKSWDQQFLSVSFQSLSTVRIFKLSDWTISKVINSVQNVISQFWSLDSRYLFIFRYNSNYFQVYDRDLNWQLSANITTQYYNVKRCQVHNYTNSVICVGQANRTLFSISLTNFQITPLMDNVAGNDIRISNNQRVFTIFQNNQNDFSFNFFDNSTSSNIFYNILTDTYQICDGKCVQCQITRMFQICNFKYNRQSSTWGSKELNNQTKQLFETFLHANSCKINEILDVTSILNNLELNLNSIWNNQELVDQTKIEFETFQHKNSCKIDELPLYNQTQIQNQQEYHQQPQKVLSIQQQIYKSLMGITLQGNFLRLINKIPGGRIFFNQIFNFFTNYDHLWLYIYHKREYGQFIPDFLLSVRNLQDKKWDLIQDFNLYWNPQYQIDKVHTHFSTKINQTSSVFIYIESQSSSFLDNTLKFFCFNLPILIIFVLVLRFIYWITSKYRISIFFKEYSIKLFLVIILLQGNLESFSYYFAFDCLHLNSQQHLSKAINLVTIWLFFKFFLYLFAWYFIIRIIQGKDSQYFFNNCNTNLKSSVFMTLQSNLLNILLGSCHILMEHQPTLQLNFLIGIEAIYIIFLTLSISRRQQIVLKKYIVWQTIWASFLRIILVITFYFRQIIIGEIQAAVFQRIQIILVIFYLVNWILSAFLAYSITAYEIIKNFTTKITSKKKLNRELKIKYQRKKQQKAKNPDKIMFRKSAFKQSKLKANNDKVQLTNSLNKAIHVNSILNNFFPKFFYLNSKQKQKNLKIEQIQDFSKIQISKGYKNKKIDLKKQGLKNEDKLINLKKQQRVVNKQNSKQKNKEQSLYNKQLQQCSEQKSKVMMIKNRQNIVIVKSIFRVLNKAPS